MHQHPDFEASDFQEHPSEHGVPPDLDIDPVLRQFLEESTAARIRLRKSVESNGDQINQLIRLVEILVKARIADGAELKKNTEITQQVRDWMAYGRMGTTVLQWLIRHWPGLAAMVGTFLVWYHHNPGGK